MQSIQVSSYFNAHKILLSILKTIHFSRAISFLKKEKKRRTATKLFSCCELLSSAANSFVSFRFVAKTLFCYSLNKCALSGWKQTRLFICCTGCRKTHNKPNVNVKANAQKQKQRQRGVCVMAPMWVTWVSGASLITSFNDRWPCLELQDNAQQISQSSLLARGWSTTNEVSSLSLSLCSSKWNVNCSRGGSFRTFKASHVQWSVHSKFLHVPHLIKQSADIVRVHSK